MQILKINKTVLSKAIKWTSSKFNEYKKREVIDSIMNMEDGTLEFECGSYAAGAYNGGHRYKVKKSHGLITLYRDSNFMVMFIAE